MQMLVEAGYIQATPLVIANTDLDNLVSQKTWETVFYLSTSGRRLVAEFARTDLGNVPQVTVDIKAYHTLLISHVMDYLRMDGQVEPRVTLRPGGHYFFPDALGIPRKNFLLQSFSNSNLIYLELDRSNNNLDNKVQKYLSLTQPITLIIATHRPRVVQQTFTPLTNAGSKLGLVQL